MMKKIALFLSCASVMISMCHGQYATMNINEMGTQFTQETIKDEKNNLLINLVPAHNGRISIKLVFDGDSDLMLMVQQKEEKCTVQRTILPTSIDNAFENIKTNKKDLIVHGSNNEEIPVITKNMDIISGYEITRNQLLKKFQPHCPPGFKVYTAHTADKDKATKEDPYVKNNITVAADLYDYEPQHIGRRQKRALNCKLVANDGVTVYPTNQCEFINHDCGGGTGCPSSAYSFTCQEVNYITIFKACTYVVVGCIDPITNQFKDMCLFHLLLTTRRCRACCTNKACGSVPKC